MTTAAEKAQADPIAPGLRMHALASELYPICRSITGEGLRATLRRLQREIPLLMEDVPSGTPVLDWVVPDEWNIREAWIAASAGKRVIDFADSNLHVVNYSVPTRGRLDLADLRRHLHTLPDRPDWIPYRTSYYKRGWGFCLPHRVVERMTDPQYDVCIDSSFVPGALTYGELLIPGESSEEFLFSAHCCHPSLANDNLAGVVVAVELARSLLERADRRLSYRFLFAPGTIGAIAWLAANRETARRIKHGLVLTCLGDPAAFTYKRSRRGDAPVDCAAKSVLRDRGAAHQVIDFSPYGYDERQFCSPGFDLPVGCLMRSQHGTFPQYHTSADNLSFIKPECLGESLEVLQTIVDVLEQQARGIPSPVPLDLRAGCCTPPHSARADHSPASPTSHRILHSPSRTFVSLHPYGEPQLGKYGFYEAFGSEIMPPLWVLNLSDGRNSLGAIAERAGLPFDSIAKAADVLARLGLVREVSA